MLSSPVSPEQLHDREPAIRAAIAQAESRVSGRLYRPFQLSDKQPIRATQHYLTKMPSTVLQTLPGLAEALEDVGGLAQLPIGQVAATAETGHELGQDYVPADEEAATSERDPFTIDPAVIDRGIRGHAATQNARSLVGWRASS